MTYPWPEQSPEARLDRVRSLFARSIAVKTTVMAEHAAVIVEMAEICHRALAAGGKILLCGNGGSAADAQHLAAELLVRLRAEVNRPGLPALALALDSSSMTACGNDYGYEGFYARMTETLGRPGDVLLGLTTSGRSPNVVAALARARQSGLRTIGFLGGSGKPALDHCDCALLVPSHETGRIQEVHITAGHALIELVEDALLACGHITLDPQER
ncbi:D-sedoheptulose-7-phosphate isomerase [Pararhodospirillum oryzae]|uniref:Phosphoheptose isomerase n=1 Tax=Pararhodospirillum oryzae TaxID=478448 RepID=A0A512HBL7_9PROT|nr:SIS domain-containing protein [Pararhodospirillum oryzae]GEO82838.1 phosphoheptose isomerase [Pararhodospirillum oryzae]